VANRRREVPYSQEAHEEEEVVRLQRLVELLTGRTEGGVGSCHFEVAGDWRSRPEGPRMRMLIVL
jgi:hypothetical protein